MHADARTYWDRHAKRYDRSMAVLGRPIPRMIELCGAAVRGARRVLEVGAGTGLVTSALARSARAVVATDYSAPMVAILERRIRDDELTNVRCEQADIYALPFDSGSFDAVVAANVLHLVPDLPAALTALRTVLRNGGILVAPTYCHDETLTSRAVSRMLSLTGFPGRRRFSVHGLRNALETAGLRVSGVETLGGLIPIGYVQGTFDE